MGSTEKKGKIWKTIMKWWKSEKYHVPTWASGIFLKIVNCNMTCNQKVWMQITFYQGLSMHWEGASLSFHIKTGDLWTSNDLAKNLVMLLGLSESKEKLFRGFVNTQLPLVFYPFCPLTEHRCHEWKNVIWYLASFWPSMRKWEDFIYGKVFQYFR